MNPAYDLTMIYLEKCVSLNKDQSIENLVSLYQETYSKAKEELNKDKNSSIEVLK